MRILIISIALVCCICLNAQNQWVIDKSHSSVNFSVEHLLISNTRGNFQDFEGSMSMKGNDFASAKMEGYIEVKSINTANSNRDAHLMDSDFFNVEVHPRIFFKSTKIKKTKEAYLVQGELSIKGNTKPVELEALFNGIVAFMGSKKCGLHLKGVIKRDQFGLNYNSFLDNGGVVISNEVDIELNFELTAKA